MSAAATFANFHRRRPFRSCTRIKLDESPSIYLAHMCRTHVPRIRSAQTPYKLPPEDVVAILDAPPPPLAIVSPTRDALLLVDIRPYPSIETLAEPILRIAGLRINPRAGCTQRTIHYTGMTIQPLDKSPARRVELPDGASIERRHWSHDGKKIAFAATSTTGSSSGSPTPRPARPARSRGAC